MNSIFMGWDPRETVAYDVSQYSIQRRASQHTLITPLRLCSLKHILTRPIDIKDGKLWCPISEAPMATEFAISRFCVPFLQDSGWALFCDSDILCLTDISELFALADDKYALMVVKHQYQPIETVKMDGQIQTTYSRKNWSSVMLWNCSHPANKNLDLRRLNEWPGRDLHAFKWLKDEEIGELPASWNHLVGVTEGDGTAANMLHYTLGGPWFENWQCGPLDDLWIQEERYWTADGKRLPEHAGLS